MKNTDKKISSICLACPRSCELRPQIEGLPGQKLCPKGQQFLKQELTEPKRHYFSTFRGSDNKIYAYRTLEEIPLKTIFEFCRKLAKAKTSNERNNLHREFCNKFNVKVTCIEP
jgi:CxxC motif-containing protein